MRQLLIGLLLSLPLFAQQKQPVSSLQEDCGVTFSFTAASTGAQAAGTLTVGSTGTTAVIDNRQAGCLDWMVTYSTTTTVTVISLAFQTATDVAGVPTTWSNYPGTLTTGINPNTAVTTGGAVTEGTGVKYPFLRMNLTAFTGPGVVQGKLYGWKRRPTYVVVTSGICPGTIATPCVVVGPTPAGSAPTTSPVLVSGQTGTGAAPGTIQTMHVDASGNPIVVGPAANGAAVSGSPVRIAGKDGAGNTRDLSTDSNGIATVVTTVTGSDGFSNAGLGFPTNPSGSGRLLTTAPYVFNGTSWDRDFDCTLKASVTLADATVTKIVAESGSTIIRVCHIHMTTTAVETFTISQGTGANCGTGLTTIDKYINTLSLAMDFQPTAALRTSASAGLCVNQSGTQAAEVTVVYAQF